MAQFLLSWSHYLLTTAVCIWIRIKIHFFGICWKFNWKFNSIKFAASSINKGTNKIQWVVRLTDTQNYQLFRNRFNRWSRFGQTLCGVRSLLTFFFHLFFYGDPYLSPQRPKGLTSENNECVKSELFLFLHRLQNSRFFSQKEIRKARRKSLAREPHMPIGRVRFVRRERLSPVSLSVFSLVPDRLLTARAYLNTQK